MQSPMSPFFRLLRGLVRRVPRRWYRYLRAWRLRVAAARANRGLASEAAIDARLACRYCEGRITAQRVLGRVGATHPGPFERDAYDLQHCLACDVVYLEPPPSPRDLDTLYLGSSQFTDACYADAAQAERLTDYYATRLSMLDLLPASGAAVLEVGAGRAWVARACKRYRSDVHTTAQDVSDECAQACSWVDRYVVGPVASLTPGPRYALISMTHVIEHLLDARSMLAALAERLDADGRLFITAPHRPPLWQPADGIGPWLRYAYLHVPAHIAYFSRSWFEREAPACGLVLERWDASHDGYQVFEAVLRRRQPGEMPAAAGRSPKSARGR
jgi:SAM-dependent methyltransferase